MVGLYNKEGCIIMTRGCLTETRAKKWQHSSPAHQGPVVQNLVSLNMCLVKIQNVTEFENVYHSLIGFPIPFLFDNSNCIIEL